MPSVVVEHGEPLPRGCTGALAPFAGDKVRAMGSPVIDDPEGAAGPGESAGRGRNKCVFVSLSIDKVRVYGHAEVLDRARDLHDGERLRTGNGLLPGMRCLPEARNTADKENKKNHPCCCLWFPDPGKTALIHQTHVSPSTGFDILTILIFVPNNVN